MSNAIVKKTHKGSFFRTVKTAREGYNWESLEIKGFDVLQVMVLNQRFVVVEYGQCEEASE